jgi:hypothetical protein
MQPGELGVLIGEHPGREQVGTDELRALLAQAAEIPTHVGVEFDRRCPFRHLRPGGVDILVPHTGSSLRLPPWPRLQIAIGPVVSVTTLSTVAPVRSRTPLVRPVGPRTPRASGPFRRGRIERAGQVSPEPVSRIALPVVAPRSVLIRAARTIVPGCAGAIAATAVVPPRPILANRPVVAGPGPVIAIPAVTGRAAVAVPATRFRTPRPVVPGRTVRTRTTVPIPTGGLGPIAPRLPGAVAAALVIPPRPIVPVRALVPGRRLSASPVVGGPAVTGGSAVGELRARLLTPRAIIPLTTRPVAAVITVRPVVTLGTVPTGSTIPVSTAGVVPSRPVPPVRTVPVGSGIGIPALTLGATVAR